MGSNGTAMLPAVLRLLEVSKSISLVDVESSLQTAARVFESDFLLHGGTIMLMLRWIADGTSGHSSCCTPAGRLLPNAACQCRWLVTCWRCWLLCGLAATGPPFPSRLPVNVSVTAPDSRSSHPVPAALTVAACRSSLWLAWVGLMGYAGLLQPVCLWLGRAVSSYVALLMLDTLWGVIDRKRPRKYVPFTVG